MEWIASLLSTVINAGWKIYLAAFIASAALLFFPNSLITELGLEEFRHSYRTYAGIVLVASASLLMVNIISGIVRLVLKRWRDRQFNRSVRKLLRELTQDEKDFLRPFIFGNANTVTSPINDGVAGGLAAKKIIYRSSNVSLGFDWPYNLQPIPRTLLTTHPELLE